MPSGRCVISPGKNSIDQDAPTSVPLVALTTLAADRNYAAEPGTQKLRPNWVMNTERRREEPMPTYVVVDAEPGTPCQGVRAGGRPCSNDAEWVVQIPVTPLGAYAVCPRRLEAFKADIEAMARGDGTPSERAADQGHPKVPPQ